MEQEEVVLPRLDRAEDHEIGLGRQGGIHRGRGFDAERGDGDRGRGFPRAEMGAQRRRRMGGVDDDGIGQRRGGADALEMPVRLARAGIFGMGRRDQVVDQGDEGAAGLAHRLDRPLTLQRAMGDEEEDLRARLLQAPHQGALADPGHDAPAQGDGDAAGAAGGPAVRVALAPCLGEEGDEPDHGAPGQGHVVPGQRLGDEGAASLGHGRPAAGIGHLDAVDAGGRGLHPAGQEAGDVQHHMRRLGNDRAAGVRHRDLLASRHPLLLHDRRQSFTATAKKDATIFATGAGSRAGRCNKAKDFDTPCHYSIRAFSVPQEQR
jgi:hypothetical protein